MLLAGLTHHLKSRQTDKGRDCSSSQASGCWRFGRRCSLSLHLFAPEAVILIEGGAWGQVHSSLAGRTDTAYGSHGTYPVGRKQLGTSDGLGICQDFHTEGQ